MTLDQALFVMIGFLVGLEFVRMFRRLLEDASR